ncbi:hypothetical protein NBH00_11445 [Paraconexibacter antarcticus]|uniref:Uncharacterized protein n=1 Tax=Paraconexibacter antarcticus TaxID=2949664 RepID=A0ABY5DZZ0_9ACTN|nr:hypothetical protein NBH00_11445 [Paraconexibacter antarcticus]
MNLLVRFFDPASGRIPMAGETLRALELRAAPKDTDVSAVAAEALRAATRAA